ncbi:MAG: PQQ-like beta-propeller repeat protein [Planctomycetes bacterium]|nr:PQQ-like beta-propeller repeat protein [Planctomycetota bacterium]
MTKTLCLGVCLLLAAAGAAGADDWPQLQHDAGRTGRTLDSIAPPFRARWIWMGPATTLRNKDSQAGWPDDLTARGGYSYPVPASVPFTIADSVQPVLSAGRVFVGTIDGNAYGIDANDGSTLWTGSISGGTWASAAVSGSVVVFGTLTGKVVGLNVSSGSQAWSYDSGKTITGAPCVAGSALLVADHGGYVTALNPASGAPLWRTRLAAPVHGGIASDGTAVYVGAENLTLYKLSLSTGAIQASRALRGQSFRMLWPMVFNGRVYAHTCSTPVIGSEYIMESLMAGSADLASEEANIARWLTGDTNGGQWSDAGADWRHIFTMNTSDLSEPFTILAGPADGVGAPAHPAVVDNSGRVLTYFKTRYPKLTKIGAFGTNYSIDVAAINTTNGHRIPIDNGKLANPWPWETDNLYGMSVGGSTLWLRQNFRGTQMIDLATSSARGVTAEVRNRDGGMFNFDVVYKDQMPTIGVSQNSPLGRTAPIISGSRVYIAESFGLTAIEHKP